MGEFDVEAIDPSIETIHVYNMVGYYIMRIVMLFVMLGSMRDGLEVHPGWT